MLENKCIFFAKLATLRGIYIRMGAAFLMQMYPNEQVHRGQPLPDHALAASVLSQLKRSALDYKSAAMDAVSPLWRNSFYRLAEETVLAYEHLSGMLRQHEQGGTAIPANIPQFQQGAVSSREPAMQARQFAAGKPHPYEGQTHTSIQGQHSVQQGVQLPPYTPYFAAQQRAADGMQQQSPQPFAVPAGPLSDQYAGRPQQAGAYQTQPFETHRGQAEQTRMQGMPKPPEFAQPHASPFGGLQQHYMQGQPLQIQFQPHQSLTSFGNNERQAAPPFPFSEALQTPAKEAAAPASNVPAPSVSAATGQEDAAPGQTPKRGRRAKSANEEDTGETGPADSSFR